MNDDDLRAALTRRARTSLTDDERNDVIRAARLQAFEPARRPLGARLAGWVAGAAAVLVLVIVVAPILLSPPSNSSNPARTAISGTTAAPTSEAPAGLRIYSAQELAAMVGDPGWIGKTVLAEATIGRVDLYGQCPPPDQPCVRGVLQGVDQHSGVLFGWRDATADDGVQFDSGNGFRWVKELEVPTKPGVFVFTVGDENAEYLGRANLVEAQPWTVPAIRAATSKDPSDDVYVIDGWLNDVPSSPCPATFPKSSPEPAKDYYCFGSWLTPTDERSIPEPKSGTTYLDFPDGLYLQKDAYQTFARHPGFDEHGPIPERGVFLARNAGCPPLAGCPVWRMVGRLDEGTTPPPPTPSSSPAPTPVSNGVRVHSVQELAAKIGDPRWVGQTILAELPRGAITPVECPAPAAPCREATLSVDGAPYRLTLAFRDATESDGTRFDDGNGYRWIKPVALPSDAGVYAFTFRQNTAEYLGSAYITPAGQPVTVADIQGISSTLPSDGVIAVGGWLVKNWPPPPCAAPPEMLETPRPALDYYCYGTWLVPNADSSLEAGVRVQNDAYEFFAVAPSEDENGVAPQSGTYLIRNAGCLIQAPCPTWSMVGRLDDLVAVDLPSIPPTQIPPATPVAIPKSDPVPLRTSAPTNVCDDALLSGRLVASDEWGLAIQPVDGDPVGVIWPNGFAASRQGDQIALVDDNGETRAVTGDTVLVGGGLTTDNVWGACGQIEVAQPGSSNLYVSNGTTLLLNVLINGQQSTTSLPGSVTSIDPSPYDEPWHVTITTESGRQLVELTYMASDVWGTSNSARGVATRVDLSCGRLDVYAGPPLLGPGPPASFPAHDCDP